MARVRTQKGIVRMGRSIGKKKQYVPTGLARAFYWCRLFLGLVYRLFRQNELFDSYQEVMVAYYSISTTVPDSGSVQGCLV
jgi:hypothetical protein